MIHRKLYFGVEFVEGFSDSHQTWKTALTVACFVPWCSMSHCLIWHSAATRLCGFVTLCGPSAPVPSIVSEFSIFGKKLGSFNWCAGFFFYDFIMLSFNSSNVIFLNHLLLLTCSNDDMIQHGRTVQHFSPGYLNVMLFLACYWHVALVGVQIIFSVKHKRNKKEQS